MSTNLMVPKQLSLLSGPDEEPKEPKEKRYQNSLSPAIDFLKQCYLVIAEWIAGKSPEKTITSDSRVIIDQKISSDDEISLRDATYGLLFTLLAVGIVIASYPLYLLAAGAVFPDLEPVEIPLLWWVITIDPPSALATGLFSTIILVGILYFDFTQNSRLIRLFVEKKSFGQFRKATLIFGLFLIGASAFLAGYRTYVYNSYQFNWNVAGIFALTAVVDLGLAWSASLGFRLLLFPCGERFFNWLEKNWGGVRTGCRFLAGLVCFVPLSAVILALWIFYGILWIPYGIGQAFGWFVLSWRKWREGKVDRINKGKEIAIARIKRAAEIKETKIRAEQAEIIARAETERVKKQEDEKRRLEEDERKARLVAERQKIQEKVGGRQ